VFNFQIKWQTVFRFYKVNLQHICRPYLVTTFQVRKYTERFIPVITNIKITQWFKAPDCPYSESYAEIIFQSFLADQPFFPSSKVPIIYSIKAPPVCRLQAHDLYCCCLPGCKIFMIFFQ
jgi:hypothetical protein